MHDDRQAIGELGLLEGEIERGGTAGRSKCGRGQQERSERAPETHGGGG